MENRSIDEIKLRDSQAAEYDEWYMQRGKYNVLLEDKAILKALKLRKNDKFLDMGCGTGRLTTKLSTRCKMTLGFDISPESIKILNSKGFQNVEGGTGYNIRGYSVICRDV